MKCLSGVLALSAAALLVAVQAEPEAEPHHFVYGVRPYYASGYASPLPGRSYQAVHRLHKREAEADPQLILGAAHPHPFAAVAGIPAVHTAAAVLPTVHTAVQNVPVVKSVVQIPAEVTHAVHHAPALSYAAASTVHFAGPALSLPYTVAAAPAAVATTAGHTVVAGLTPADCVTEAGCAVRTALLTGAPTAAYGSAAVIGRRFRRDAEAEPTAEAEADADADAAYLYNTAYNGIYGGAFPYTSLPYTNLAYNSLPYNAYNAYNYNPLAYLNNYYAGVAPVEAVAPVAPAVVKVESAAVPAAVVAATHISAPYAAVPHVAAAVPYAAPTYVAAPVVPKVATVAKEVTYTHLGAHPISPTTVLQTESQLVY